MEVPVTPTQITPEWLTPVLRRAGVLERQAVRSVTLETLPPGQGISSLLVRLCVEYDAPAPRAPASLIAKLPHHRPDTRASADQLGFYEREARFYQLLAGQTGLRVPRCYFSAYNPVDGACLLLLEDLGRLCVGRTRLGSNPAEAEAVLAAIAALHAAWWNRPELAEFVWLWQYDAPTFREPVPGYPEILQRVLRHLGNRLPAEVVPIAERLEHGQPFLHAQLARRPWTLVHNDPQMDNLFFDEQHDAIQVVVVDWQTVARARAPYDVALFLGGSVPAADRRAYEAAWLAHYHRLLLERGVGGYSFEQCLYDYRLALLAILGRIIYVAGTPQWTSEDRVGDWVDVLGRLSAAVLDNGAGALLAG